MWGSYIGLLFLASAFVAIGVFASCISENQIISFIVEVFFCFIFHTGFDSLSSLSILQSIQGTIINLGINQHYISMSRGVIDTRDVIYFLSLISFFIGTFLGIIAIILRKVLIDAWALAKKKMKLKQ